MAFNIFTTKRVFCFGQYHRIDHLVTCNLRGDKRTHYRQFLVGEFHFSAVCECLIHSWSGIRHLREAGSVCGKHTLLGTKNCGPELIIPVANHFVTFRVLRLLGVPSPCRPCERHMPIHPREILIERIFREVLGRKILYPSATYDKS